MGLHEYNPKSKILVKIFVAKMLLIARVCVRAMHIRLLSPRAAMTHPTDSVLKTTEVDSLSGGRESRVGCQWGWLLPEL